MIIGRSDEALKHGDVDVVDPAGLSAQNVIMYIHPEQLVPAVLYIGNACELPLMPH